MAPETHADTSGTALEARIAAVLDEIPDDVTVVAAAKTRSADEVAAAIRAGIRHVGHNYVQEAEAMRAAIGHDCTWHLIGHLQRNKAKRAVTAFDVIETIDSTRLADAVNRRCAAIGRTLPVLLEVNIAGEASKAGVAPPDAGAVAAHVAGLDHLRLTGLMTMGAWTEDPEDARSQFKAARRLFEELQDVAAMPDLSMGMSDSFRIAIDEGATIVRLGTVLFGPRAG